jgi:hypothetical protein
MPRLSKPVRNRLGLSESLATFVSGEAIEGAQFWALWAQIVREALIRERRHQPSAEGLAAREILIYGQ